MASSIRQTLERRTRQDEYNSKHGITPKTIVKALPKMEEFNSQQKEIKAKVKNETPIEEIELSIEQLKEMMQQSALELDFERAAFLRDLITRREADY